MNLAIQLPRKLPGVRRQAFPHRNDTPAQIMQPLPVSAVPRGISIQLLRPKRPIVGRRRAFRAATVPVPEAAVNKESLLAPYKTDVLIS